MPKHKLALCIGINDYPGTDMDLSGCVNDARDWAKALKARGFETQLLLNRQATGAALRAALRDLIASATQSGDLLVVQFSGHGSFVPDVDGDEADGTDEALCPYDVKRKGVLTDDELSELYSARRSGVRLAVFSDSCHSGTIARFAHISTPPTTKGAGAPQRRVRFLPPATYLSNKRLASLGARRATRSSSPPGRSAGILISGCQDAEFAYDAWFRGRPNGVFTYVALSALQRLPKRATYQQWHKAIRKILPNQQYPQQPNLYGTRAMKAWPVLT